ncbi:hypothetical protein, partial [Cohnella sp.]|uniref:hypothetical protein n=1 Tax=Cohnella sp. TaxID=1883426 RepID=UPI003703F02A
FKIYEKVSLFSGDLSSNDISSNNRNLRPNVFTVVRKTVQILQLEKLGLPNCPGLAYNNVTGNA